MRRLNYEKVRERIVSWIAKKVREGNAKGVVLGLSGGIDSTVVAYLCNEAVGRRMTGLIMPEDFTPKNDVNDARIVAKSLKIKTYEIPIHSIVKAISTGSPWGSMAKIPLANVRARVRMILLYAYANQFSRMVAGTGDKSEALLGYFTKYGDGGTDMFPIGDLYKSEVRQLGSHLGVPVQIVNKPSSPQLYPGHRAVDEIPADYSVMDDLLYHLFELGRLPDTAAETRRLAKEINTMNRASHHKRELPPICRIR